MKTARQNITACAGSRQDDRDVPYSRRAGPRDSGFVHKSLVTAVVLAELISTLPGFAAEGQVEEIIVTGQGVGSLRLNAINGAGGRLGLSAFDTPASVDLISKEEIAAKGDYGALDAITRSAGISSSANPGNGGTSVSSRGFNGHDTTVNTYDGTRLYIVAGTVTFPADTWTLERIEVLRGAGSVINGVGALGTTINYIPKAPVFGDGSFDLLLAGGSFGMNRVALGGGAQISEDWAFRLDVSRNDEDGFADRADEKREVLAGSLLFRPSEEFSMKFSVDYADIDAAPFFGTPLIDGQASTSLRRQNFNFEDAFARYKDLWARVHTEWQLTPALTFRNDSYYIDAKRKWQNIEEFTHNNDSRRIDRAFFLSIIHDQEQFGSRSDFLLDTELAGMSNKLTLGAEINVVDLNYHNNFATGGFDVADSVPVFGFDPGRVPTEIPTVLDYTTDSTQYALFFDDVLQLTETLSVVFGGRYDNFDFKRFDFPIGSSPASEFKTGFNKFTWRAGVVYQPFETFSVYAQTSTAADPVTSPISISAANKDFDLSTGRQYEIGMKQQILSGRAEYTLAYFDIEKEDMLTRRPGSVITEQIGQQSSTGVEFTFRANPLDSLSIDVNAAVIDAKFDEFFSGGVSLAGNEPNNVPEKTANLWVNWTPIPQWQLGAGLRYVDKRFGDNENTQTLPSYTVFDASVSWQPTDTVNIIMRVRNLTDEKDYVLSQYAPNQWIFGDPRAYEVSLRYSL
ncbi:MAG: TonB-dependent siderophore receptor [Pseudomonadales bacterium]|nr:TonB-dependent siderophore receptor [Pseudomonadales bacterium]